MSLPLPACNYTMRLSAPSRRSVFLTLFVQLLSLIAAALFNVLPRRPRPHRQHPLLFPPSAVTVGEDVWPYDTMPVAAAPTPTNDVSDAQLAQVRDQPPIDPQLRYSAIYRQLNIKLQT